MVNSLSDKYWPARDDVEYFHCFNKSFQIMLIGRFIDGDVNKFFATPKWADVIIGN